MQDQGAWEAAAERRRRSWLVLAVVAIAAVAVAAWVRADERGDAVGTLPVDVPATAVLEGLTAAGEWTSLGTAPLRPSASQHALWTGSELLVWGGAGSFAAFDPAAGSWREPAPGPVHPAALSPVWTGTEALVWGSTSGGAGRGLAGAAYTPASDSWRPLPEGPLPVLQSGVAAWTGQEVLIWGRWGRRGLKGGATYDPVAGRWHAIPLGPTPRVTSAGGVWTGRSLVVWGTTGNEIVVWGPREPASNPGPPRIILEQFAAVYRPDEGRWRQLPPPPLADPAAAAAAWTGHEVVLLGEPRSDEEPLTAAAIDPHDRPREWRPLPPAPRLERSANEVVAAWTGERLLAVGGVGTDPGWAYDPEHERWEALPAATAAPTGAAAGRPAAAWTGERLLLVVSEDTRGAVQLLAWQPE